MPATVELGTPSLETIKPMANPPKDVEPSMVYSELWLAIVQYHAEPGAIRLN